MLRDPAATSLNEALKTNTTLKTFGVNCQHKKLIIQNHTHQFFTVKFIFLTVNFIGETGATSLSDVLKINTTLTRLDLIGEKQHINNVHH